MKSRLILALALAACGAFSAPTHKPLASATILVIRHAEKPESGDGLTPAGEARAAAYPRYFAGLKLDGHTVHFTHLFAAKDSEKSHRPRLTIEPLAKSLHQTIDLRFTDKDRDAIVADLRAHDYGNEILISWRHGKIPDLLTGLGADPGSLVPEGDWPDTVFDRVIELHFDADGKIVKSRCRMLQEHLMPGDEK